MVDHIVWLTALGSQEQGPESAKSPFAFTFRLLRATVPVAVLLVSVMVSVTVSTSWMDCVVVMALPARITRFAAASAPGIAARPTKTAVDTPLIVGGCISVGMENGEAWSQVLITMFKRHQETHNFGC